MTIKKYKVTLRLMVDSIKGDETFKKSYEVEAQTEFDAYAEACKKQSMDVEYIKHRSIFNYNVKEINN